MVDSDDHVPFELLYDRERPPARRVTVEAVRDEPARRGDRAQQRLAQRVAPRAHRAHVARTRPRGAVRVRVHEPDDVAALLLASQRPAPVGADGVEPAAAVAHAPRVPDSRPPLADERPAFLDVRHRAFTVGSMVHERERS